jgi:hypothetical protein
MRLKLTALVIVAFAGTCFARDARQDPGFLPEHVDTSKLHPPSTIRRESRPLYERVEQDIARGEPRGNMVQPSRSGQSRAEDIVVEPPRGLVESTLARYVREQEQLLDAVRQRYQEKLHQAEVERDKAMAAPGATRTGKALAARRFNEKRLQLTRTYQAERQKALGNAE